MQVGTGNHFHPSVLFIQISEREPHGDGVMRKHRPIVGVLMPTDCGAAKRLLDKEAAGPTIEIRSDNTLDEIVNSRIHYNFIEKCAGFMPLADIFGRSEEHT